MCLLLWTVMVSGKVDSNLIPRAWISGTFITVSWASVSIVAILARERPGRWCSWWFPCPFVVFSLEYIVWDRESVPFGFRFVSLSKLLR